MPQELSGICAHIKEILNTVGEAIITIDASQVIHLANREAERIFGYKPGDLCGRTVLALLPEEYRTRHQADFSRAVASKTLQSSGDYLEFEGLRQDGTIFPLELRFTLSIVEGEQFYTAAVRDITARKQAEEALKETQEKARQQDHLAVVGQLAAGIAHDFNNLLTVMMGTAQLVEMRPDTPDTLKEQLSVISSQGERAAQLVRQILDFSRQTIVQRKPVDLAPFMKETVRLLARTLPENIQIVSKVSQEKLIVEAALAQLQQVITNLAVNAQHAMPEGGQLQVSLSLLHVQPNAPRPLPEIKAGYWVEWRISDTGIGISQETIAHIFEPFFTTKGPDKGTGLGLAQVYGIIKQHGGEINVQSALGKGTVFTIYLPQVVEAEAALLDSHDELPKNNGETILVVEDQIEVRDVAQYMLESLGYKAITAANGQKALAIYDKHQNKIDLVLTDIVMPKMGGQELFEKLKQRDPNVKVVVMTGYPLGGDAEFQPFEGTAGYLEKPLNREQIAKVLNQALKEI